MKMRVIRTIIAAAALLGTLSCEKVKPEPPDLPVTYANIDGTWRLDRWKGSPLAEGTWCYIEFSRSGHVFTMHQNLDSMYDRELTGTFTITQDDYGCYVLNGSYDWGRGDWTSTYNVKGIKHDGSSMTWTSTADESDVSVYVRIDSLPELK